MESIAVGPAHFSSNDETNSYESGESENDDQSQPDSRNNSDHDTAASTDDNRERAISGGSQQSGSSSAIKGEMGRWAMYVCKKIIETFTDNEASFDEGELAKHITPGAGSMELVDSVMPALKAKVDQIRQARLEATKRSPTPSSTSSSLSERSPSPPVVELVPTIECATQCDLEKSVHAKLAQITQERDKNASKLENLQKENEAISRKLEQSKRQAEQDQQNASKSKKTQQETLKRVESDYQLATQGKLELQSKLSDRQEENNRLEGVIKEKEDRIKKLVKDQARLESTNEENTARCRKDVEKWREQHQSAARRSDKHKFWLSAMFVLLIVLLVPWIDLTVCCRGEGKSLKLSYMRQVISWMDFTRFERLATGQC